MVVGAKVCDLTDGHLWFVCGLYVGILTSPLKGKEECKNCLCVILQKQGKVEKWDDPLKYGMV